MNWRRAACVFGFHRFGVPLVRVSAQSARLYVRCTVCQTESRGIQTAPHESTTVNVQNRLQLLKGRVDRLRIWG